MANTSARGIDPTNLMEKILQTRILRNAYWKEHCFGLTEESLAERAIELDHFGGTFGGNKTPTPFICLILAMLQMQPDQEIVLEFIKNEDYKYVRALGAFYLRLVGQAKDIYRYLEPLLMDLRKMRKRTDTGFVHVHMDSFVEELLSPDNYSCDLTLPFLSRRSVLEENGDISPRQSALQGTEEVKTALAPLEAATQRAAKKKGGDSSESESDSDSELESNYRERVKRERWRKSSSSRRHSRSPSRSRSPRDRRSRHDRRDSRSPRRSSRRDRSRDRDRDRRDRRDAYRRRDDSRDRDRRDRRRSPSPRYSRSRDYDRRDRRSYGSRRSSSRSPSPRDRHRDRRSRRDRGSPPTPYERPRGRNSADRRPDRRRTEQKEVSRPSSKNKGEISLSVEETNKMRASLGLPPLK